MMVTAIQLIKAAVEKLGAIGSVAGFAASPCPSAMVLNPMHQTTVVAQAAGHLHLEPLVLCKPTLGHDARAQEVNVLGFRVRRIGIRRAALEDRVGGQSKIGN